MSDLDGPGAALAEAIASMPLWARRRVLAILDGPPTERASFIRDAWSDEPGNALAQHSSIVSPMRA